VLRIRLIIRARNEAVNKSTVIHFRYTLKQMARQ
jgi:hypothetical protein